MFLKIWMATSLATIFASILAIVSIATHMKSSKCKIINQNRNVASTLLSSIWIICASCIPVVNIMVLLASFSYGMSPEKAIEGMIEKGMIVKEEK